MGQHADAAHHLRLAPGRRHTRRRSRALGFLQLLDLLLCASRRPAQRHGRRRSGQRVDRADQRLVAPEQRRCCAVIPIWLRFASARPVPGRASRRAARLCRPPSDDVRHERDWAGNGDSENGDSARSSFSASSLPGVAGGGVRRRASSDSSATPLNNEWRPLQGGPAGVEARGTMGEVPSLSE